MLELFEPKRVTHEGMLLLSTRHSICYSAGGKCTALSMMIEAEVRHILC